LEAVQSKKLAALLMLPMLMFVVVPFASHAQSSTTYILEVECNVGDSGASASAQVSFLGHSVSITCTPDDYSESTIHFQSFASGVYSASAKAGPLTMNVKGYFNPYSCYADGVQYDPALSSWAYWEIYTGSCEG